MVDVPFDLSVVTFFNLLDVSVRRKLAHPPTPRLTPPAPRLTPPAHPTSSYSEGKCPLYSKMHQVIKLKQTQCTAQVHSAYHSLMFQI